MPDSIFCDDCKERRSLSFFFFSFFLSFPSVGGREGASNKNNCLTIVADSIHNVTSVILVNIEKNEVVRELDRQGWLFLSLILSLKRVCGFEAQDFLR